jgi:transcriptional regulator with XRE-family HTH domain
LRALDERERRIVFLRFHADMTERQIAQAMGISQAHVSRLLDGALTKLRAELTDPMEPAASGDSAQIEAISPSKIASVGAEEKGQDENTAGEATPTGRRSSKPRANAGYSGRILVRMPSELHEQLAAAAEREEISLNRYVNDALTNSVEASDDEAVAGDDRGAKPSRLSPRGLRVALATNLAIVVVAGVVAVVLLVLALQRGI